MQSQKLESEFQPESKQRSLQSSVVKRLLTASIVTMGAIAAEAILLSVQAASLTNWNFDPAANQLEITVKDGTTPRYFLMAQPARIVVDLPDTAVGDVSAQQSYSGAVRQIRVSQFEPGLTRIVMEISPGVSLAPGQVKLQKVGNDAARSGNARWVLQPLITKSFSENAVTVKPSTLQSGARTTMPAKPVAQPTTGRSPAIAPTAIPSATAKMPISQKPSATASTVVPPSVNSPSVNLPSASLPAVSSGSTSTAASPTTTGADTKPSVAVPAITATPPTSVSLAPVLPSPPSTAAQAGAPAETPLPPVAAPSADPNVAVDTQGSVAIAVPTPTTPAPPTTAPLTTALTTTAPTTTAPTSTAPITTVPSAGASTQPSVAAPTQPLTPTPRSTADPTARSASNSTARSTSRANGLPVTVKPAPATVKPTVVANRVTTQATAVPSSAALNSSPLEIPTTMAAAPLAPPPSVSVPPLSAPSAAPNAVSSQSANTALEAPSDRGSVSTNTANASLTAQPTAQSTAPPTAQSTATAQPRVSVPPLIRVGSPSLGASTGSPPLLEAAPPSVFSPNATLTPPVAVPPLQPSAPTVVQPGVVQPSYDANTVRQPASSANLAPPLNVPLQTSSQPGAAAPVPSLPAATPGYDASTVRQPPASAAPTSIVEFGQPLPATARTVGVGQPLSSLPNASTGVRQAFKPTAPNVLLPAGTTLNLRYPGNATLTLNADRPQQELLVLLIDLRDASGNLLAPAGSTVTGRFETTTSGSQFVTQAIVVAGRMVPLAAQSDALEGARNVENHNLARNSGIGVLAGGVLGAIGGSVGLGALGGAAAGAATTLLTAPKPAIVQPGQIVQVRLTQDLRSTE